MNDFATRWDDAVENSGVIKAGKYVAKILKAGVSDKNMDLTDKRKYVDWEFVIEEGPYKSRRLWQKNYIDPKPGGKDPIGIVKGQCKALGLSPKSLEDLALQLEGTLNTRVNLTVTEREWNGKTRNEVRITGAAQAAGPSSESDIPF